MLYHLIQVSFEYDSEHCSMNPVKPVILNSLSACSLYHSYEAMVITSMLYQLMQASSGCGPEHSLTNQVRFETLNNRSAWLLYHLSPVSFEYDSEHSLKN